MQGLHLVGRILLDHGDTIVTEAPTFMGALGTWEHQQPTFLTVSVDEHGMDVDGLEAALKQQARHPKFVYALPTFQNPSGVSLSLERRKKLLALADQYNLFIIEDDPYGEFWFDEGAEPNPPLRSMPGSEERVIYLGTFSKILAPGIRLAYAVGSPRVISLLVRAKRGVDFHTDTLVQQGVVRLFEDPQFDFEAHVELGRQTYKARRDAVLDALETTFMAEASWTRPTAATSCGSTCRKALSATRVTEAALREGVAVFPGPVFFPEQRRRRERTADQLFERHARADRRRHPSPAAGGGRRSGMKVAAADERISAQRLWRGGRARRVPESRAGSTDGCRGALLRLTARD